MQYLRAAWDVLAAMAPWLLGGFLLAGAVGVLVPRGRIVRLMGGGRGRRGILNAVLIGVPLPICSCGVLPLAAGLRKAGAGRGATAAFLVSTPQTGIDSVCATYALMGPVFAMARPLVAFATGLAGGLAVEAIPGGVASAASASEPHCACHGKCCDGCCDGDDDGADCHAADACCAHKKTSNPLLRILRHAYIELLGEVALPLAVGLAVAAAVSVLVPEGFFADVFGGNDWLAMPAMILLGFPMYVCSTASIPIAASMVAKGLSPAAAFVFLVVGPAVNAASLTTIAALVGRRGAAACGAVIAAGAILGGLAVGLLAPGTIPPSATRCYECPPGPLSNACAAILVLLMAWHLLRCATVRKTLR